MNINGQKYDNMPYGHLIIVILCFWFDEMYNIILYARRISSIKER